MHVFGLSFFSCFVGIHPSCSIPQRFRSKIKRKISIHYFRRLNCLTAMLCGHVPSFSKGLVALFQSQIFLCVCVVRIQLTYLDLKPLGNNCLRFGVHFTG